MYIEVELHECRDTRGLLKVVDPFVKMAIGLPNESNINTAELEKARINIENHIREELAKVIK